MLMGYFSNSRVEMLKYVPLNAKRILDVGCGEGVFGYAIMRRQNCDVWGIEPDQRAAEIARKRLNTVIQAEFNDMHSLPKASFDCIVFNDVLEHMIDPWNALRIAKTLLRSPESVVVASIPNFRCWGNMLEIVLQANWEYKNGGLLDITHLRFFTFKSINKLFKGLEYDIKLIEGINPTQSEKYRLLNALLFNRIWDMRYQQFAVVAKVKQ